MIYPQSAVIPYRVKKKGMEVLLVTSSSGRRWVAPKGLVESGMTAWDSAAKEALEEAGVLGKVSKELLGSYRYEKWGGQCEVEVYAMRVTEELSEWDEDDRDRAWYSPEEAADLVKEKALSKMILRFASERVAS